PFLSSLLLGTVAAAPSSRRSDTPGSALLGDVFRQDDAELVAPGVADVGDDGRYLLVVEDVPPARHAVFDEPVEDHVDDVALVGDGAVAGEARADTALALGAVADRAVRREHEASGLHDGGHLLLGERG